MHCTFYFERLSIEKKCLFFVFKVTQILNCRNDQADSIEEHDQQF
jgi:hypothetical protein